MSSLTEVDDKVIGLTLAISSSFMIGISSIITKKGLMDVAQALEASGELEELSYGDMGEDDGFGDQGRRRNSIGGQGRGASDGMLPKYLTNYIWWAGELIHSSFNHHPISEL
jgi:hypothetical protein